MKLVLQNLVTGDCVTLEGVTRFCQLKFFSLSLDRSIESIKIFTVNRSYHYPLNEWKIFSGDSR